MKKPVKLIAELMHETDNAYLFNDGENDFWIPKSQCADMDQLDDTNYEFSIPEWLAIKNGVV